MHWSGKQPDFKKIVRTFCREVLGCQERVWINRAHPIGRDGKSIIAHIPDDTDLEYILSQARNLKGTRHVIHRDFPREIRLKRSRLVAVRKEIDQLVGGLKMPLVHDHLQVKGTRFTWEEGKLRAGPLDGALELRRLFRHDFSNFLVELSKKDTEQRNDLPMSTQQTYAEVTSHGTTTPTTQKTLHAASQEKPSDQDQAEATQMTTSQDQEAV